MKSLLNQTDKDFVIWLQFRPEEETNPLIKTFNIPHEHIFTFNGIGIWDDKKENEEQGLLSRLQATLPKLKEIVKDNDVKLVNVGSDDMYSSEVIESVNKEPFEEGVALTHRNGYVYNHHTDRLAEWKPETNPPFYTLMYKNETFLNPEKHYEFIKGARSHEYFVKVFKERRMPDWRYCVLTHRGNISTIFEHPFKGQEFYNERDKNLILKRFI